MITPLDIKKHEFAQRWMGYDKAEVGALLDTIARDFEEMVHKNTQLSERVKVIEERLNHYRLMEKTLQDAVLTMQNTLEEKRRMAEQEAELIIQEARQRAKDEVGDTQNRVVDLRNEINNLEMQKRDFFVRFRSMLKSQLDVLHAMIEADASDSQEQTAPEPYRHAAVNRPQTIPHSDSYVRDQERDS